MAQGMLLVLVRGGGGGAAGVLPLRQREGHQLGCASPGRGSPPLFLALSASSADMLCARLTDPQVPEGGGV